LSRPLLSFHQKHKYKAYATKNKSYNLKIQHFILKDHGTNNVPTSICIDRDEIRKIPFTPNLERKTTTPKFLYFLEQPIIIIWKINNQV